MNFNALIFSLISQPSLIKFPPKEVITYQFKTITCYQLLQKNKIFFCKNKSFKKNIIISAPHAIFEIHTLKEAISVFVDTKSRYLIVNSTFRCQSEQYSKCDGKTRVCGGIKEAYRSSDMAHTVDNLFYLMHINIYKHFKSKILQLHETKRNDISYIISAGSNKKKDNHFKSNILSKEINIKYKNKFKSVSCQNNYLHLCGSTNTVGRFVNGSNNSCHKNAKFENISGNFIHIEQNYRLFTKENKHAIKPDHVITSLINKFY